MKADNKTIDAALAGIERASTHPRELARQAVQRHRERATEYDFEKAPRELKDGDVQRHGEVQAPVVAGEITILEIAMEVITPEQCASAYALTNYYHGNVIEAIRTMVDEVSDQSELDIVSGLLRGSLRHMLDEAQKRIDLKATASQHITDTQGPPTMIGREGGIPVMKLNDGKRR